MRAGDIYLEGSSFRYFYFVLISFMSTVYISQFFPPKLSSICFIFHLSNTQFFMSIAVSFGS